MANPFNKKTWQNRLSEFPTRRQLVDVSTGNTQTVDVTRNEGQIYNTGDGFTQANMNDLEQRIYDAFEDFDGIGALSHNVPRVVPKDITAYYNDGTLWSRLDGINGFSPCEDIFVGDYFQMSRIVTCPHCEEGYGGTNYIRIVSIKFNPSYSNRYALLVMPTSISRLQDIIGCFGSAQLHSSTDISNVGLFYSDLLNNEIGLAASSGSTDSNATISQQLLAEFGEHLYTTNVPVPKGINNGRIDYEQNVHLQAYLMSSTHLLGYPYIHVPSLDALNDIYQLGKDDYYDNHSQLMLFKFLSCRVSAGTIHPETQWHADCFLQDMAPSAWDSTYPAWARASSTNSVYMSGSDPTEYHLVNVIFILTR